MRTPGLVVGAGGATTGVFSGATLFEDDEEDGLLLTDGVLGLDFDGGDDVVEKLGGPPVVLLGLSRGAAFLLFFRFAARRTFFRERFRGGSTVGRRVMGIDLGTPDAGKAEPPSFLSAYPVRSGSFGRSKFFAPGIADRPFSTRTSLSPGGITTE